MVVTPDDFRKLGELLKGLAPLGSAYARATFDWLVAAIQPTLVITEPGGATEWLANVAKTADLIHVATHSKSVTVALENIARIAEKYQKTTGLGPQRRLDFIRNADLRRVAEDDWNRLVAAGQREDAKTTAIAAGSVIEAIALDIMERLSEPDAGKLRDHLNALPADDRMNLSAKGALPDWKFSVLLLALGPRGLKILSPRTYAVGHTLRDWRNFVHPKKASREPPLSASDGRMAAGFAGKVVEDVETWTANGAELVVPP